MNRLVFKDTVGLEDALLGLGPCVAFDTETTGLDYMTLSIEGFSVCDGIATIYVDLIDKQLEQYLSLLQKMLTKTNTLIMHNAVFDLKVLKKYKIDYSMCRIYCTMVADHLIDENRSHALKFLCKELLGKEVVKYDEAERAGHQSKIFYEYALNDAEWTYELCIYQQSFLREQGLGRVFRDVEMPFQHVIVEMETTGMKIDIEKVKEIRDQLGDHKEMFLSEMMETLGLKPEFQSDLWGNIKMISPKNFNSSAVLSKILFKDLGLPIIEQTKTGNPAVGKITMDALKDKHPFVGALYKYKIVQKLLSSYFEENAQIMSNIDSDGRVRPHFIDTGTKTGRLACIQPNLQQLPKQNADLPIPSRAAFCVEGGNTMITADYSGQEIRVMAEISKDPTLVASLNKGYDMHLAIANQFYNLGIPEEALMETHNDYERYKKQFKGERTKAKTITFGLAYGKGAYGFAKDFGISEEEAQGIVDDYFKGMPGLRDAIERSHKEVEEYGYVTYLSGRRRRFDKIAMNGWEGYSKKSLRQAFNASIQGFSADMMRMACNKIYLEKKKYPEWGLKLIGTVHDEMILEVKSQYTEEASKLIKFCMETAVSFCVPTPADVSIGNNYDEAK